MAEKLIGADSQTFKLPFETNFNSYGMDKNYAYFNENKIKGLDTKTFENIDEWFTKDKNKVYHNGEKIVGSDPETFELIDVTYSKDKNYVYINIFMITNSIKVINGADPETFEIVDSNLKKSKDKNNCFIYSDIVNTEECNLN